MVAIYEMEPIGVDGALEANGRIFWFCSADCAFVARGLRLTGPNYSAPEINTDAIEGTACEHCGKVPVPEVKPCS